MLNEPVRDAPRVFVSHASEDSELAAYATALVERSGLRAWTAARDIPAGADHGAVVPEAIASSDAVLLLLSPDATASPWVVREVEHAVARRVTLVPVALPTFRGVASLSAAWAFRLSGVQIRLDGDLDAAVTDLRSALALPDGATTPIARPTAASRPPVRPGGTSPSGGSRLRVATSSPRGFVGKERLDAVDWLSGLWRAVTESGAPRLAILLGETGFGKTRIVQEFYRSVAVGQPDPPFWPLDLVASPRSDQPALRESRKRVSPADLSPTPGAEATFLWLGHVVDEGHGGRVDTGLQHLGAELGRALSLSVANTPAVARMIAAALEPIPESIADVRYGIGELLHRGTGGPNGAVAPGSVEAYWQGLNALWADAGAALPTVLVIEDGHFAGRETVQALELVATSGRLPFLVVVCAQESQLGGSTTDRSASDLRRPLGRLVDEELPSVSVRRLGKLAQSDVRALFLEAIPELDEETSRAAVVKADGNPYHAHTLLVEMARAAERGRLDPEWVRKRPGTFEEELRLQWRLLPDDVRRVLSGIAVLGTQVPERICLHALRTASDGEPVGALDASVRTGWLRRLYQDDVLRFLERPRWVIANAESAEEWDPDERRGIISEALGTLERLASDVTLQDPLLQEIHLALALTADVEDIPFDRAAAVRSGLAGAMRLRLANDDGGTLAVAQDTERLVLGHDTEPALAALAVDSALAVRFGLANAFPQGGTSLRTVAAAELAVERALRVAQRRPDLVARAHAALSRAHRVRFDDERLAASRQALSDAEAWLERMPAPDAETSADVMHARGMYAKALGDNRRAAEIGGRRRALLERMFGPLDRRVTSALLNEGFYWTRIDIDRALELKRDLLDRRRRTWGDQRTPQVASAEKELAFSLARRVDGPALAEAHALARRAVEALTEALGANHNSTAMAGSVAVFTGCRLSDELETRGQSDLARELRLEARSIAQTNLDSVRPGARPALVLIRRQRLAECHVRLGDPEGVTILREVLDRRSEGVPITDQTDIEVLWVAAELAAGLFRAGSEQEVSDLAADFLLTREERWPGFQPRGWASTRPQDARAGVM